MREIDYQVLERRWRELFDEYDTIKMRALAQVVEWEWTTSTRHALTPLYFERFPGRGRKLKKRPENYNGLPVEYGLDRARRVLVERQYHPLYPPIESFWHYTSSFIEIARFSSVTGIALPGQIEHLYLTQGLVSRYASFKLNGFGPGPDYRGSRSAQDIFALFELTQGILRTHETYHYDGTRLQSIVVFREGYLPTVWKSEEHITYAQNGVVQQIRRVDGNHEKTLYRKRSPSVTFNMILNQTRDRLVETIPVVIGKELHNQPLYCIQLWYREADFYFPPIVIPGFDSVRNQMLLDNIGGTRWEIWTPPTDRNRPFPPLPITDILTIEACEQADQEIHKRAAWTRGRQTLQEIARQLTQLDWSPIIQVTPDFVVFALDSELGDVEVALKASVSEAQIQKWKAQRLL